MEALYWSVQQQQQLHTSHDARQEEGSATEINKKRSGSGLFSRSAAGSTSVHPPDTLSALISHATPPPTPCCRSGRKHRAPLRFVPSFVSCGGETNGRSLSAASVKRTFRVLEPEFEFPWVGSVKFILSNLRRHLSGATSSIYRSAGHMSSWREGGLGAESTLRRLETFITERLTVQ